MDIPEKFQNLPEIKYIEMREMIDESVVHVVEKAIRGDALVALHQAIVKNIPVNVNGCLIDGDLNFTEGDSHALRGIKKLSQALRNDLKKRGVKNAVFVRGSLKIEESFISRIVLANVVYFRSETSFSRTTFRGGARFFRAIFDEGADFFGANFGEGTNFAQAIFVEGASFYGATFCARTSFRRAILGQGSDFSKALFDCEAGFSQVVFCDGATFRGTRFRKGIDFNEATFKGSAIFWGLGELEGPVIRDGKKPKLEVWGEDVVFDDEVNFCLVTFETPEKIVFQNVNLRKAHFLETLIDKVHFKEVRWLKRKGRNALYEEEKALEEKNYEAVARLYRQLKLNFEEKRDYSGAGDFHYGEMEMAKNQHWENKEWYSWLITRAYKLFSGYGEKSGKALLWAIGILLIPGVFYYLGEVKFGKPPESLQNLMDCLGKSLGYMTFRIYEMPNQTWAKVLAFTQAVLGPIQLALAALALRRKFRR